MKASDNTDKLAEQLASKIAELEALSVSSDSALDAEKFRKSAFRLRAMQAESTLYQLIGQQVSLNKFRYQSEAKAVIAELAQFAKLKPEQQQVADLYRQLKLTLIGVMLPFGLSLAICLICAIWLF